MISQYSLGYNKRRRLRTLAIINKVVEVTPIITVPHQNHQVYSVLILETLVATK